MGLQGNRIRQARRQGKLTQEQLARAVGVHRSAVAQWEQAGGSHPTAENLARIAAATKVSFEWIATGRGRMEYLSDLLPAEAGSVVTIEYAAQDASEVRALVGLRRLDFHQAEAVVDLIESLVDGKATKLKRKAPFSR
jgi:transcriptional regulator with XRE-family HTH domain